MEVDKDVEFLAEVLAADSDEEVELYLFELMGTNHEIATGKATFEEFLEKSKARRSKQ
jgi:hypothetical protein